MDSRTRSQRWADLVTEFSGSWTFIGWFCLICAVWMTYGVIGGTRALDPYPFLFLNGVLTIVSTLQNPLILLSQNRQNDNDRAKTEEILSSLARLQTAVNLLRKDSSEDA